MKGVRITTKSGEIRISTLAPHPDLVSWWQDKRLGGQVIGDQWCMPFSEMALADLVELADPTPSAKTDAEAQFQHELDRNISRMAVGLGAGLWRPPGDSH